MSSTITPRNVEVRIYQGDDLASLSELRLSLDVARRRHAAGERGADTEAADAAEKYEAAVTEAADRAVTVKLQAVGVRKWRSLRAEHPPRKVAGADGTETDHDDDAPYGVNVDEFAWPLLRAAIVEPAMGEAACDAFLDTLSEGDFERLFTTAYYLNVVPGSDPFVEMRYGGTTT